MRIIKIYGKNKLLNKNRETFIKYCLTNNGYFNVVNLINLSQNYNINDCSKLKIPKKIFVL